MAEEAKSPRTGGWIIYVLLLGAALLLSGVLTPKTARTIPYDVSIARITEPRVLGKIV